MSKNPCTYILASARNGTLYIGVTSNLTRRVWQHKNNKIQGFTDKYHVHMLVYYEQHETMQSAITREKQLKKWKREWKIKLIEKNNADWQDLWVSIQQIWIPAFAGMTVSCLYGEFFLIRMNDIFLVYD